MSDDYDYGRNNRPSRKTFGAEEEAVELRRQDEAAAKTTSKKKATSSPFMPGRDSTRSKPKRTSNRSSSPAKPSTLSASTFYGSSSAGPSRQGRQVLGSNSNRGVSSQTASNGRPRTNAQGRSNPFPIMNGHEPPIIDVSDEDDDPVPSPPGKSTARSLIANAQKLPLTERPGAARRTQSSPSRESREAPIITHLGGSSEEEETIEQVEQFPSSSESKARIPPVKSFKGKEPMRDRIGARPPAAHVGQARSTSPKRRLAMQKKDGTTPAGIQEKLVGLKSSAEPRIQSSQLPRLADVEFCNLEDEVQRFRVRVENISVNSDSLTLKPMKHSMTRSVRFTMTQMSEAGFAMSTDASYEGFVRMELRIRPDQYEQLCNMSENKHRSSPRVPKNVIINLGLYQGDNASKALGFLKTRMEQQGLTTGRLSVDTGEMFHELHCNDANFVTSIHDATEAKRERPITEASRQAALAAEARLKKVRDSDDDPGPSSRKGKRKADDDPLQRKLVFGGERARRTTRGNRLTTYTEPTSDSDDIIITAKRRSPRPDGEDVLFTFPYGGKASTPVNKDVKYRLMDKEFMNDTFIEFALRYVVQNSGLQHESHIFSTYFYQKLSDPKLKATEDTWPAYEAIKKWTKNDDVFSKKYLIVPINERFHWYLAVIYNPQGMLKPRDVEEPPTNSGHRPLTRSLDTGGGGETSAAQSSSGRSRAASAAPSAAATSRRAADSDRDPLDCISDNEDDINTVEVIQVGVEDLSMEPEAMEPAASPQPIQSQTFDLFTQQGLGGQPSILSPSPEPAPAQPAKSSRQGEGHDILGTDSAWVFVFDSLAGRHPAVGKNLANWLIHEAKDKRNIDFEPQMAKSVGAKVPQQPNWYDCGLYLVHYVNCFLSNPQRVLQFMEKPRPRGNPDKAAWEAEQEVVWQGAKANELRDEWVGIIDDTAVKMNSLEGNLPAPPSAPESSTAHVLVPDSQASVVALSQLPERGSAAPERASVAPQSLPVVEETSEREPVAEEVPPNRSYAVSPSPQPADPDLLDAGDHFDYSAILAEEPSPEAEPDSAQLPAPEAETEPELEPAVGYPRVSPSLSAQSEDLYGDVNLDSITARRRAVAPTSMEPAQGSPVDSPRNLDANDGGDLQREPDSPARHTRSRIGDTVITGITSAIATALSPFHNLGSSTPDGNSGRTGPVSSPDPPRKARTSKGRIPNAGLYPPRRQVQNRSVSAPNSMPPAFVSPEPQAGPSFVNYVYQDTIGGLDPSPEPASALELPRQRIPEPASAAAGPSTKRRGARKSATDQPSITKWAQQAGNVVGASSAAPQRPVTPPPQLSPEPPETPRAQVVNRRGTKQIRTPETRPSPRKRRKPRASEPVPRKARAKEQPKEGTSAADAIDVLDSD